MFVLPCPSHKLNISVPSLDHILLELNFSGRAVEDSSRRSSPFCEVSHLLRLGPGSRQAERKVREALSGHSSPLCSAVGMYGHFWTWNRNPHCGHLSRAPGVFNPRGTAEYCSHGSWPIQQPNATKCFDRGNSGTALSKWFCRSSPAQRTRRVFHSPP